MNCVTKEGLLKINISKGNESLSIMESSLQKNKLNVYFV